MDRRSEDGDGVLRVELPMDLDGEGGGGSESSPDQSGSSPDRSGSSVSLSESGGGGGGRVSEESSGRGGRNEHHGCLRLVKDLTQDRLDYYTLRRVEHLRRSVTNNLRRLQNKH